MPVGTALWSINIPSAAFDDSSFQSVLEDPVPANPTPTWKGFATIRVEARNILLQNLEFRS
jgi:hypothetical protein